MFRYPNAEHLMVQSVEIGHTSTQQHLLLTFAAKQKARQTGKTHLCNTARSKILQTTISN
jgi:hypothetical protein